MLCVELLLTQVRRPFSECVCVCAPLSVGAAKCVRAGELLRRCVCSVKWESNSIICVFAFHVNLESCGGAIKRHRAVW